MLTLSVEKKSIYVYDSNGKFLSTVNLPFQAHKFEVFNDNLLGFYVGYYDQQCINLYITDMKGKVVGKGFPYPEGTYPINLSSVTGGITNGACGNLLYTDAASSYIYSVTDNLEAKAKYFVEIDDVWPETKKYKFKEFFSAINKGEVGFLASNFHDTKDVFAFTYNLKRSDVVKDFSKRKGFFFKSKGYTVTQEHLLNDPLLSLLTEIKGVADNSMFISTISPLNLLEMPESKLAFLPQNVKFCLDSLKETNNPLLYLFRFKN